MTSYGLEVSRMTVPALFARAITLTFWLDPLALEYRVGQERKLLLQMRDILVELEQRGTQLSLLSPEAEEATRRNGDGLEQLRDLCE